jgi:hypothetical protein
MPHRWCTSAPDSWSVGFSKNASRTRNVCSDILTLRSSLPMVESLHRVFQDCKHFTRSLYPEGFSAPTTAVSKLTNSEPPTVPLHWRPLRRAVPVRRRWSCYGCRPWRSKIRRSISNRYCAWTCDFCANPSQHRKSMINRRDCPRRMWSPFSSDRQRGRIRRRRHTRVLERPLSTSDRYRSRSERSSMPCHNR